MKKKIIAFSIILIFVCIGLIVILSKPKFYGQLVLVSCRLRGGKIFLHSFAGICEVEGKDNGKKCIYDNECLKNMCLYPDKNANEGSCDGYIGDNDGVYQCHHQEGKEVQCDLWMS